MTAGRVGILFSKAYFNVLPHTSMWLKGSCSRARALLTVAEMKTKDDLAQKHSTSSGLMGRFTCQSSVLVVFLSQRCLSGRRMLQEHPCLNSEFSHFWLKMILPAVTVPVYCCWLVYLLWVM